MNHLSEANGVMKKRRTQQRRWQEKSWCLRRAAAVEEMVADEGNSGRSPVAAGEEATGEAAASGDSSGRSKVAAREGVEEVADEELAVQWGREEWESRERRRRGGCKEEQEEGKGRWQ